MVGINLFFNIISIPMLCAHANFEVNTRSIYARNYDFLSVAIKKISTVSTLTWRKIRAQARLRKDSFVLSL